MAQAPYALLADVDGPISNPDAKAIVEPRIIPSLVSLLNSGVPLVFNTGRSSDFVQKNVFKPILEHEPSNLHLLHAVCEKGAVWLSLEDDGDVWHFIDEEIAVPEDVQHRARKIVNDKYQKTMFWDETKESMISVERRADVDHDTYQADQPALLKDFEELLTGLGYEFVSSEDSEQNPNASLRIDVSIIAIDIESIRVGKDLGAERAFELLRQDHPTEWRTIGDSGVDYKMADWLHEHQHTVVHIDVGPKRQPQQRPYPVLVAKSGIHDEAGGAYVQWLARKVHGDDVSLEEQFDR